MFGPKSLDLSNLYSPDLQNIQESAERTYGEANSFYRKEELYLKDVERRLSSGELSSEKDIYDECHAIASDLAKCCEMYLKALYIYEQRFSGFQIDDLWEKLKSSEFRTDTRGNLIYLSSTGMITFCKYDAQGNPLKDENGKVLYFDENNNIYSENSRGKKIKRSGHQLDRLIEMISPESNLLLEIRMLAIPMEKTEQNPSISILDVLSENGVLQPVNLISSEQYVSWIEQHKKTFEESRYSGQKKCDVNIEFLYHLATQIKAVVQYKISPMKNQKFSITDSELSRLPEEIKQFASFHSSLLSEELIRLIANDNDAQEKIKLFSSQEYIFLTKKLFPSDFYKMIQTMSVKEIKYVLHLCYLIQNYNQLDSGEIDDIADEKAHKAFETAGIFKVYGITPDRIVGVIIQIKETFGENITICNEELFKLLRNIFVRKNYNNDFYKSYYNVVKTNYDNDIYNKFNNKFKI